MAKTYAEVEKSFNLRYHLKCKQRGFAEREQAFFNRIPVNVLAKQTIQEQAKMVDYVTRNTVDSFTPEQIKEEYINIIRIRTFLSGSINQAALGNMAYILLKIGDQVLIDEWLLELPKFC